MHLSAGERFVAIVLQLYSLYSSVPDRGRKLIECVRRWVEGGLKFPWLFYRSRTVCFFKKDRCVTKAYKNHKYSVMIIPCDYSLYINHILLYMHILHFDSIISSWYIHTYTFKIFHTRASSRYILIYFHQSNMHWKKKDSWLFFHEKRKQTRTEDLSQPVIRNGPTQLLEGYILVITVFNPKDVQSWFFSILMSFCGAWI